MAQTLLYSSQNPVAPIYDSLQPTTRTTPLERTPSCSPPTWPSSPALDSNSSSENLSFDIFAPFRPRPAYTNQILTRDLDDLLKKCSASDFEYYWRIRLSRHENWCRRSPGQHLSEFMTYEHGSGDDTWPPEYSPPPVEPASNGWLADFVAGCKAMEDRALHHCAAQFMERWKDQPSVQLLAQQSLVQYYQHYLDKWIPERTTAVVPFISLIHSCFETQYGVQTSRTLALYVQESTMETFKTSWSLIVKNAEELHTPTPPSDIKQALLLSRYLGALFRADLIPCDTIQTAFSLLLQQLRVVEQIQAIYYIVLEAGNKLWYVQDSGLSMDRWSHLLGTAVAGSTIMSAASGDRVAESELQRWIACVMSSMKGDSKKRHMKNVVESFRK